MFTTLAQQYRNPFSHAASQIRHPQRGNILIFHVHILCKMNNKMNQFVFFCDSHVKMAIGMISLYQIKSEYDSYPSGERQKSNVGSRQRGSSENSLQAKDKKSHANII